MNDGPSAPDSTAGTGAGQHALFDDEKDPQAFRTIGEVAQALGIKPHVLRYWEEQFAALEPVKRSGGRRYYRSEDIALLRRIHTLIHDEGYTIRGAAKALSARALPLPAAAPATTEPVVAENSVPSPPPDRAGDRALIERLRTIRRQLADGLS